MYWYTGNFTFSSVLVQPATQWGSTSLTAIFITVLIAILSAVFRSSSQVDDNIHNLGGFHLVAAWSFFTHRHDFLRDSFNKTGLKMFYFHLFQHRVIAMAGEENRKIFYNDRNLDMSGYRIFLGGLPKLKEISVNDDLLEDIPEHFKRLQVLVHEDRVKELLPLLLEDINRKLKGWGTEGTINPFNEVYDLVFQMTIRMASCRELADDPEAVRRLAKNYSDVSKNATFFSTFLPWFPGPAQIMKKKGTIALYLTLLSYVKVRRKALTPSIDAIDFFISQGMSNDVIVEIIMTIIFAGVTNTGINASWALLHLGANPNWKHKAIDECKKLVEKHTNTTSLDPLHIRLSAIPLHAWENELPSLEVIIRETLRLSGLMTSFRRNVGKDIRVGEATIKQGDILVYSNADANLNPDIYTNPMTFDPDRYGPGREEDRKAALGYTAWGVGRHPCAGMKIAKLEIKVALAMILLGYEYELVDGNGNYPKAIPEIDRNDIHGPSPLGDPCYMKYKRIVE